MKISVQNVDRNIVKIVCGMDVSKSLPGVQILPEVHEQCVQEGGIQTEVLEKSISFRYEDDVFAHQSSFELTEKDIYRYTFTGDAPVIVTEKTIDGERSVIKNADTVKVAEAYQGKLSFSLGEDEAIYGLGQQENGYFNYRGMTEYFYQNNMKIAIPVLLSSKGYAIVFDIACMFVFEEKNNCMIFDFDAVNEITYYVIYGKNFDELIHGIRSLSGKAMMLPKWAFGYVQSKERYKTGEEIVSTVKEFQKREIPISCIVLDWHSWEKNKWGNKIFDKSRFPDAKQMVDDLHSKGVSFMISVWPNMHKSTENNHEMAKQGKLLCDYSTYDAFDSEARDLYWKQCEQELFAAGTDAWWCDSTEPFTPDWSGDVKKPDAVRYQMAKDSTNKYLDARYSNLFALYHARGIYEHQRAVNKDKRVLNLTRSGSLGSQRYGTVLWSGDIAATWDVLKHQIAEGQSICMSGIPYWTMDAGAFFTGRGDCWRRFIDNPEAEGPHPWFWHGLFENGVMDNGFREYYVRCLQLATYLPMMRSHGTDTPREPWHFGEKGSIHYDTIVKYIKKRYQMMPYSYSLGWKVYQDDYTIMRSLMFDFSEDKKVKNLSQEFMYGPSFLVCPVTKPMEYGPESEKLYEKKQVSVYLPQGANWYNEESGEYFEGGCETEVYAGVEIMPVFVRAGAIIPSSSNDTGEFDQVFIYGGEDGYFDLFLDNGMDYSFEQGQYSLVSFQWKEVNSTLSIVLEKDAFEYPRYFKIIYRDKTKLVEKEVNWDGKKMDIKFK